MTSNGTKIRSIRLIYGEIYRNIDSEMWKFIFIRSGPIWYSYDSSRRERSNGTKIGSTRLIYGEISENSISSVVIQYGTHMTALVGSYMGMLSSVS